MQNCYPTKPKSFTKRWRKFKNEHILDNEGKLKQEFRDIVKRLGGSDAANVERELEDFPHELSKPRHHLTSNIDGVGFVCGGPNPLGGAVGAVVVIMQRQRVLDMDVRFVNESFKDVKFLKANGGEILDPRYND